MALRFLVVVLLLLGTWPSTPVSAQSGRRGAIRPGMVVTAAFAAADTLAHEWRLRGRPTSGLVTVRIESLDFTPTLRVMRYGPLSGISGVRGWVVNPAEVSRDSGSAQTWIRFEWDDVDESTTNVDGRYRVYTLRAPNDHYSFLVGRGAGQSGSYRLQVIDGPHTKTIRAGEAVTSSVDESDAPNRFGDLIRRHHYEDWLLEANADDSVVVRAHSPDFPVSLIIGTRSGEVLTESTAARASRPGEDVSLVFSPVRGTRYVIRVLSSIDPNANFIGGSYSLSVGRDLPGLRTRP